MAKFRPLPRPCSLHPDLVAIFFAGLLLLGFLCAMVLAKSSPRPISDTEIREKKQKCYADIESGMWGWKCRSSLIEMDNCALRCLSPACYQLVYESDQLEEGENDIVRGQEFKFCMRNFDDLFLPNEEGNALLNKMLFSVQAVSLGESLEGVKGSFDYF